MSLWKLDTDTRVAWDSYLVRVVGPHESECHGKPTLLVRSMPGGFVTANCSECGERRRLNDHEFRDLGLWVACPQCKKRMHPVVIDNNYAYSCHDCEWEVRLSDLLPPWSSLLSGQS